MAIRDIEDKRARERAKETSRPKGQPRKAPPRLVEGGLVQGWNGAYGALSLAFRAGSTSGCDDGSHRGRSSIQANFAGAEARPRCSPHRRNDLDCAEHQQTINTGGTAAQSSTNIKINNSTYTENLARELALLTAHRSDLIADRVRMINRLRDVMTSVFPTLEQQFDYSSHKGALILLTEYASPKRLRRLGETRLTQWLRRRQVRDAARVAARALAAARGQDIELSGQHVAEMIIAELAGSLLQRDQRVRGLDQQIAATFRRHHQAMIIESMRGFGPILGAQLLVAAGDLRDYPQRRPPGCCSRSCAGPQRLRPTIRQPAQAAP